jgi:decaprenylphospho-beta-D-ribofuranose 2-oxidase
MKIRIGNWNNYPTREVEEKSFSIKENIASYIHSHHTIIARGNGRCYGDASLSENVISTLKYNNILSFDANNGIIECESGITLHSILEVIVPKGWFLHVTPGTKFITLGGAVASDVHGKNHRLEGSFSNHVLEMELALATGEIVTCSKEYLDDLFEATFGGMGLTGIILKVKFQLKKIESGYISQTQIKAKNITEIIDLFEKHKHNTYCVAWIDCLKKGNHFGRGIITIGEHSKKEELSVKMQRAPLLSKVKKQIVLPFKFPTFLFNKFTMKFFNTFYYKKNIKKESNKIIAYDSFFYPLDSVSNWNKMYGKNGFIQYQFVLPLESKKGLIEILQKIDDEGFGTFLSVLKIFGKQNGMISFPKEGISIALDFPLKKELFPFLDELDKMVVQYNGRIYLTKDARMKPETFWKGYERANEFQNILIKYKANTKFSSDQSKRLHII